MKLQKPTASEKQKTGVDWGEVRHRLDAAREALKQGWTPILKEKRKILKKRAAALARKPEEKAATAEYVDVIEFLVAHERYGIESSYVGEVYPLKDLTPIPGTPGIVLGIINVRGQMISVIDIKKFFDLPEKGLHELNKVIILRTDDMEFGILADNILGVRSIPVNEIQAPFPTLTDIREEYLKGVTKERLVVLDGQALLSDKRIIVQDEVER